MTFWSVESLSIELWSEKFCDLNVVYRSDATFLLGMGRTSAVPKGGIGAPAVFGRCHRTSTKNVMYYRVVLLRILIDAGLNANEQNAR